MTALVEGSGERVKMQNCAENYVFQAMPRSTNPVENNRIIMDLRILSRAYDCPHIVHSFGYIITEVINHCVYRKMSMML